MEINSLFVCFETAPSVVDSRSRGVFWVAKGRNRPSAIRTQSGKITVHSLTYTQHRERVALFVKNHGYIFVRIGTVFESRREFRVYYRSICEHCANIDNQEADLCFL